MTSTVTYEGNLRTTCTHVQSGNTFITDAPTDNNGKGEAFSPTDTVATALASCMLTIMGIKAETLKLNLNGSKAEVLKKMEANPRRIAAIHITIALPKQIEEKHRKTLENAAKTCPVYHSLHPDMEKKIQFNWTQ